MSVVRTACVCVMNTESDCRGDRLRYEGLSTVAGVYAYG